MVFLLRETIVYLLGITKIFGSMSAFEQLRTYLPLPNRTLIPSCYQLTVVGLREG